LDQYILQASAYTGSQVKRAVRLCFDTEYGFKSGRLQVDSALEALIIKLLNLRDPT
jgi:DNA polymerase III delta subunit